MIKVHGHRGARARRPENSLAAFAYALDEGVDVLELDLAVTRDDVLVVQHDLYANSALCTFANGSEVPEAWLHREHTLAEVKRLRAVKQHPRFPAQAVLPDTTVATLDEVFELVKGRTDDVARRVEFNIETKIKPAHPSWTPPPAAYAELVVKTLKRHGMVERTYLQSFDKRTLLAARSLAPTLRRVMLTSDNLIDFVAAGKAVDAFAISPDHEWILDEDVRELHKAGLAVIPWTANDEPAWERLCKLGVDAIITDDPAPLLAFLRRTGRR